MEQASRGGIGVSMTLCPLDRRFGCVCPGKLGTTFYKRPGANVKEKVMDASVCLHLDGRESKVRSHKLEIDTLHNLGEKLQVRIEKRLYVAGA
jgi:hypothetical protein